MDRYIATNSHPWRIIASTGPVFGNAIKGGAWLLPLMLNGKGFPYAGVTALSGAVAGPEYALSKTALMTAHVHEATVNEHVVATLMFATDNLWRTGLQCAVDKSGVTKWDWVAVGAMIVVAGLHAAASHAHAKSRGASLPLPAASEVAKPRLAQAAVNTGLATLLGVAAIGTATANVVRQRAIMSPTPYGLATLATVGKAGAWWLHLQPFIQRLHLNVPTQILAGWQTAFWTEYWALIGAITMGSHDGISLPLMFGYMVALENVVRMAQFNVAGKSTQWFDYASAAALAGCVVGQGVTHALDLT